MCGLRAQEDVMQSRVFTSVWLIEGHKPKLVNRDNIMGNWERRFPDVQPQISMTKNNVACLRERGKGSGVWPSMVTHTWNLSSAFNPSKCTLTAVNTHLEQWAAILRRPGSSWGIGALLKGLTSVVVLKVERALVIHSPHRQSLPDLGIEPATFGLQVQLSNH